MKKIITIILLIFSMPFYGQWIPLNSGTTAGLNDVYCVNENIVFAVGNNGTILKTTDGGINWISKNSGTNIDLYEVQFPSINVGYAIGHENISGGDWEYVLIKTIDAGESWFTVEINTNVNIPIFSFSCVNEEVVYISTFEGLKKTIDGGNTIQIIGGVQIFDKIQFIDNMVGFASSYDELLKTNDGGITWLNIGCIGPAWSERDELFHFLNENIGFTVCSNNIYKTSNGGEDFSYLTTLNWNIGKIYAVNENIFWGMTVDYLLNGQPIYTMRGEIDSFGNLQTLLNEYQILNSIHFVNPTLGYASEGMIGGVLYKNTTGTMLGVNEASKKQNLTIYPNPATNQITVSLAEMSTQSFEIEITNMLGKKVYSQSYQPINNVSIDTKTFSKGVYFLTLIQQEKKETQKIIID